MEDTNVKKYVCVQVRHHNEIGGIIDTYQGRGWRLHTYQAAQTAAHTINHYLLFESVHEVKSENAWSQDIFRRSEA